MTHRFVSKSHSKRRRFDSESAFAKIRCGDRGLLSRAFKKVKCPKCGFVSYPGPVQCKKCGYVLSSAVAQSGWTHASRFRSVNRTEGLLPPLPPSTHGQAETPGPLSTAAATNALPPFARGAPPVETNPAFEPQRAWRDELARRVELFHDRRAQLRQASDPRTNLEFDFSGDRHAELPPDPANPKEASETLDLILDGRTGPAIDRGLILDSVWIAERGEAETLSPNVDAKWAFDRQEPDRAAHSPAEPVEIILDTGQEEEEEPDLVAGAQSGLAGPLGVRFAAGVLDGFVLLVAFGLFTLIFWESGGRLSPRPVDLAIVALAVAVFVLLYFGLFTVLAFATPGQSALALRVRTLDGEIPDSAAAIWRAFGYLVSAAALMLGFVWAVFDGDRLAWHDRMSGTCLVAVDRNTESR